jgi:DNA-3-methyladenine glycosylase II
MTRDSVKKAIPPEYWQKASTALMEVDTVMGRLIAVHRPLTVRSRDDAFLTIARLVVGQQLALKTADAIWLRMGVMLVDITPRAVIKHDPAELQTCGLSTRKVQCLTDLAIFFIENSFDLVEWQTLADDEIIKRLTAIKGIGQWTAEMFLIFFMARPNVLPVDDISLQRAMSRFYNGEQSISKLKMREIAARLWEPWSTVATWYLWRSLEFTPIRY